MAVRTRKHVTVTFKDGTGTPIEVEVGPGPGDLQIQGLSQGGKESLPVYNRGAYLEAVEGDEKQITASLTIYHDGDLTTTGVVWGAINKANSFSAGVTVDPGGVMWHLDVVVEITVGAVTNTITLSNCRIEWDYSEAKEANTIPLKLVCYGGWSST